MLKPASPGIIGGAANEADELSTLLGDDHDLAVLRESLESAAQLAVHLDAVLELIDRRREQLQAQALRIGERLYAESPTVFVHRMHRYWKASHLGRSPVRAQAANRLARTARCGGAPRRPGVPGHPVWIRT